MTNTLLWNSSRRNYTSLKHIQKQLHFLGLSFHLRQQRYNSRWYDHRQGALNTDVREWLEFFKVSCQRIADVLAFRHSRHWHSSLLSPCKSLWTSHRPKQLARPRTFGCGHSVVILVRILVQCNSWSRSLSNQRPEVVFLARHQTSAQR